VETPESRFAVPRAHDWKTTFVDSRVRATLRSSGPLWTASLAADRLLPVGVLRLWRDERVTPDALARQVGLVLRSWGMPDRQAEITVEHVLYADVHGIDSHGSSMLRHYAELRRDGVLDLAAVPKVVRTDGAIAVVDGGGGLGHAPAELAMETAIASCRAGGVGVAAVRESGHFGAAGSYAARAAEAGLAALVCSTTRSPAVVPALGVEPMLGTNPIAIAAPAAPGRPFLLDMATSTVSSGRLTMRWRRGRRVPRGWAVGSRGLPISGRRLDLLSHRLTPLGGSTARGGHKGYGLALAVELLAGVLAGGDRVGHLFVALDPARLRDDGGFVADADALIRRLRACAPRDPRRPVLVPGDPERAEAAERRRLGIPLTRAVLEDLRAIARAAGVPFVLDGRG
jgi:LDH2 family malate/lactate/ureidoglycolate dehydrogenase